MKPEAVSEKRKDKIPYEHYREKFKRLSIEQILKNPGVEFDAEKNLLKLDLLNRSHIVSYPSGDIDNGREDTPYPVKTLLIRYLLRCSDIPPSGKMINYREVPDGNLYFMNFYNRCIQRLSFTFNDKLDKLEKAAEKLDAVKLKLGDISYRIKFMHNVYIDIILWNGDEEFPPSSQILFSDSTPEYFTAEDMAFVGDILINRLKELAFS